MIKFIIDIIEIILFVAFCIVVYKTIKFYDNKLKDIQKLVKALKKQCIINKNIKWHDVKRTCEDIEIIIEEVEK